MACFDNVVALKELCDEQTPFSGFYLNDVGITRAFIESIITSDYDGIQDFVDQKTAHATRIIETTIHNHFGARLESTSLIIDHRLGFTAENQPVSVGGEWRGIKVTLSNYVNHVRFDLSEISLHVNYSGSVPIHIYDLYQNKLLDIVTLTAVSGQIVTDYPHITIKSPGKPLNLFIGYDATAIDSVTTYLRRDQCCGSTCCTNEYLRAQGVSNDTGHFNSENCTAINHTSGLSIVYSLSCDPYSWMCGYAKVLALPIAYKTASEMYLHGIMNAVNYRSSNTTNLNVDGLRETQQFYEVQYREQIESLLKHMRIPDDSVCFQCKSPARTAIILP